MKKWLVLFTFAALIPVSASASLRPTQAELDANAKCAYIGGILEQGGLTDYERSYMLNQRHCIRIDWFGNTWFSTDYPIDIVAQMEPNNDPKTLIYYDEACFVPNIFDKWVSNPAFDEVRWIDREERTLSANLYRNGRMVGFSYSTNWPIDEDP